MESFWERNSWWIYLILAATFAYYLFAHAQFMPLRDGYYACKLLAVEGEGGKFNFPIENDQLIISPVEKPDEDTWVEESGMVNGKEVQLFWEDLEESLIISNRLTYVPILGSSVPQVDQTYYRSFGVSDLLVLRAVLVDPDDKMSDVRTVVVAQCHKDW